VREALSAVTRVALGVWAGAVLFFSAGAAPALFARLPREEAGRAVAAVFPVYYATGWIAAAVALAATALHAASRGGWTRQARWRAALVAVALAASLYGGVVLLPRVRAARAAGDDAGTRRGHAAAVALNVVTLAAVLGALALATDEPPAKPRP
jgi:hypothetical protein